MEYQEFPKVLNHPAHESARKISEAIPAHPPESYFATPEQWQAERWPQVTVNNADDEAYYAAKGYAPAGQASAAAFEAAHASPYTGRKVSEWPKMVNGVLVQDPEATTSTFQKYPMWMTPPDGGEPVLANNAAEEEALLAQWTAPDGPDDDEDDEDEIKPRRRGRPPKIAQDHV